MVPGCVFYILTWVTWELIWPIGENFTYLKSLAATVLTLLESRDRNWPWENKSSMVDANLNLSQWRHQMETFSALLALCAGNSPVTGEFPAQRPVTRSFHVFVDLCLNKRLSKQSWRWWFETPSRSLWRHCNVKHFCWNRIYMTSWADGETFTEMEMSIWRNVHWLWTVYVKISPKWRHMLRVLLCYEYLLFEYRL